MQNAESIVIALSNLKRPWMGCIRSPTTWQWICGKRNRDSQKIVPLTLFKQSRDHSHIGFVKVGMPRCSIDFFPADFGVLKGEVKSSGSDALAPNQLDNRPEYRYPATVESPTTTRSQGWPGAPIGVGRASPPTSSCAKSATCSFFSAHIPRQGRFAARL